MSNALAHVVDNPEPRLVGDTARYFKITVVSEQTGQPFDLGGTTCTFKMRLRDAPYTVIVDEAPCEQNGGSIWYVPQPQDVANDGHYLGRFKVVTTDGVLLFGHVHYEIQPDL